MATIDGLLTRIDALIVLVGRPNDYARYAAEFDTLEARDAEGAAEEFERRLIHALTIEYVHEGDKPMIVKLFESCSWEEAMQVLRTKADAQHQIDKERYILARMRGWKH